MTRDATPMLTAARLADLLRQPSPPNAGGHAPVRTFDPPVRVGRGTGLRDEESSDAVTTRDYGRWNE